MEDSPWSSAAHGGRAHAKHRREINGQPQLLLFPWDAPCWPILPLQPNFTQCIQKKQALALPHLFLPQKCTAKHSPYIFLLLCGWLLSFVWSGLFIATINFIWVGRTHPLGLSVCWRLLLHWCHKSPWLLLAWHN